MLLYPCLHCPRRALLTWKCAGRFIMASGSSGFVPAAGSAPKGTLEHAPPGHGEMMWEEASFSCLAVHLFLLSSMRHCDGDNMLNICASRHRRLLSRCFPLHCLSFVFRTSRSPKVRCVPRGRTQIGSLPNQAQTQRAMLVWSTLVLAVLNGVHGLRRCGPRGRQRGRDDGGEIGAEVVVPRA